MNAFDEMALAYDNTIDWKSRLNREMPLLLSLLENKKRPRVLDMACGSGRHSVALVAHNIEVIGFDSSESMIKAAKLHAEKNNVNVQFLVADMENIKSVVGGPFDLVICLGNSLALFNNIEILKSVIEQVHEVLRDNGTFLAQVLNFEEIHWTGFRTFPMKKGKLSNGEEVTFARMFEHSDYPFSSTLVMSAFRETNGTWTSDVSTQKVLNLNYKILRGVFDEVGFSDIRVYADYMGSQFDHKNSRNMIFQVMR